MKASFGLMIVLALMTRILAAAPDLAGKWKWIHERNGESLNLEMTLEQKGSNLSGKIVIPQGQELKLVDGRVSDDGSLTFHVNYERDSGPLKISFQGKAIGDTIKGHAEYTTDDGEKHEREWNPKREASRNFNGRWTSVFKRSDGTPMETTLQLKQAGATLTGTQVFNENESEISDGRVDGENISFRIVRERDGRTVTAKYKGKVQKDNSIKGEIESDWTGEIRRLEWEARKQQ